MFKKQTGKLVFIGTVVALLTGLITAKAAFDSDLLFSKCSLGIYPYNPDASKTVGPFEAKWFNLYEDINDKTCANHLTYPNQYSPNPPNPKDPGIELKNVNGINDVSAPTAQHNHTLYNASVEDNFVYKNYIDSYQIILEQDALNNVDNIICVWPDENNKTIETPGCDTNSKSINTWGGTTLDYENGTVTWKFAVDTKGRPRLWGKNPSINTNAGHFGASVKFTSIDKTKNNQFIWSATTTSRALIRDLAFKKTPGKDPLTSSDLCANDGVKNNVPDYNGKWCTMPAPNIQGVEQTNVMVDGKAYYWFRIGVVGTVWKAPPPPPPAECNSLDIDPTGPLNNDNLQVNFKLTPDVSGNLTLKYKWTATQNGIITFDGNTYNGSAYIDSDNKTAVDKKQNLDSPLSLTVIAVDAKNPAKTFAKCQKTVKINPVPVCNSISVKPAGPLDENDLPQTFTISSSTDGGLNLDYKWTADQKDLVTFDKILYNGTPYYETANETDVDKIKKLGKPLTLTVTAVNQLNHAQEFGGSCQKIIKINPVPVICKSLQITDPANKLITKNAGEAILQQLQLKSDPAVGLQYKWNTSNSEGTFDNKPQPYLDQDNKTMYANPNPQKDYTINVIAVDDNGENQSCKDSIKVTVIPPPLKDCTDLKIFPTGPISESDLPEGIIVNPTTTGGLQLDYKWTADQNGLNIMRFDGNDFTGTPYFDTNLTTLIDKSKPLIGPVNVTVTAVDKANHQTEFTAKCQKTVVINPPPKQLKCDLLNLKVNNNPSNNNVEITEGDTVTLQANPQPDAQFPLVQWSETGNSYFGVEANSPQSCQVLLTSQPNYSDPANDVSFIAPANCSYTYTGALGGTASVKAYSQQNLDIGSCMANVSAKAKPPKPTLPKCQNLVLNPTILNENGQTGVNAVVNLDSYNGQSKTFSILWSGDGLINGQPATLNQTITNELPSNLFQVNFNASYPYSSKLTAEIINISNADNSNNSNCKATAYPPPLLCKSIDLSIQPNQICIGNIFPGQYTGPFNWFINGSAVPNAQNVQKSYCLNKNLLQPNDTVSVSAPNCNANYQVPQPPPTPPILQKYVKLPIKGNFQKLLNISNKNNIVEYKLEFTATSDHTTAQILDNIGAGGIQANPGQGKITYQGPMQINIAPCSPVKNNNCYTGSMANNSLVLQDIQKNFPITIIYLGKVADSAITTYNCKNGTICQEKYKNTATAFYGQDLFVQSEAFVQIFCQYILTRAAGDIYLEKDLENGIDISKNKCSIFKNSTGLIVVPKKPEEKKIVKTGADDKPPEIFTIDHEVCTQGQSNLLGNGLEEFYNSDKVSGLSSEICEVKLNPGKDWQKSAVTNSIKENKTRLSRWQPTKEGQSPEIHEFSNDPYEDLNVIHIKNGDLTVANDFTLQNGQGAKTFIVENGDLVINADIKYDPRCNKSECNLTDTESLAFIVLNGNVYIAPEVKEISGVFFVQQGDNSNNGKLFSGTKGESNQESDNKLTVYGSIFGDIEPLFGNRTYSGDPASDEGGIVIRFDERIILNTPPGLRDILDVSEQEVAR